MQQVNQVLPLEINNQALQQMTPTGQKNYSQPSQDQVRASAEFVNRIFLQLKGIFPGWTAAMKTEELEKATRQQWLKGLVEAGMTTEEKVEAGLVRCRAHNSPFLPSVGQFIAWCREATEAADALPSEVEARLALNHELARPADVRDWTRYHPAVFWVYCQRSSFDWKEMKTKDQREAFGELWMRVRGMVQQGFNFNIALTKKPVDPEENKNPASLATAEKFCGDILGTFGNETTR